MDKSHLPTITNCECQPVDGKPFVCGRHKCRKTIHWHHLCRTDPAYFEAWEAGHGPGQRGVPPRVTRSHVQQVGRQAWQYTRSLLRWVRAGRPVRTEEEVQRIVMLRCSVCPSFSQKHRECQVCGCGEKVPAMLKGVARAVEGVLGRLSGYQQRLLRKIAMATEGCPRRLWFPAAYLPIKRRNLLYHVCAHPANDIWRQNVKQVLRHWDVFNGRKLIVIAKGSDLLPPEIVQEVIGKADAEYVVINNDTRLREMVGLAKLLDMIRSTSSREASFFGHTKGNTSTGDAEGIARWRNAMYANLLGRVGECMKRLETYAAVGTTKMTFLRRGGFNFPSGLRHGSWMFAGTFFWFRHDVIFAGHHDVPRDRYGAEAWLGGLLPAEQGYSVFQPWPERQFPPDSPYSSRHYLDYPNE